MSRERLSTEECLERIAKVKASGMSDNTYLKVMCFNKNYVHGALLSLKRQNSDITMDQVLGLCANYISTLRSYMDADHSERVKFLDIYEKATDLGFNHPNKSASLGRYLSDNGYDEYWYRRMRTGYKYYDDIFRNLHDKDKLATINKNSAHTGPLEFVVTPKLYPITESKYVAQPAVTTYGPEAIVTETNAEPKREPVEETKAEVTGVISAAPKPDEEPKNIPIYKYSAGADAHISDEKCWLTVTIEDHGITKTVELDFPFVHDHVADLFDLAFIFAKRILEVGT